MSESRETLKHELNDFEYRHAYDEDFLNASIAVQIRALRGDMKQEDFGKLIGTKQEGVSRLENVNHSSWKTETLGKIARACDVRLIVKFARFTTLLDDAESFSKESLKVPRFTDDPYFRIAAVAQDGSRLRSEVPEPKGNLIDFEVAARALRGRDQLDGIEIAPSQKMSDSGKKLAAR